VRLTNDRRCLLVVVGARADGTKELVALADGERESEQSWLGVPPKLAVADGALAFWPTLEQVWPSCKMQRCWVHKTANVLDKLPKKPQPEAKERLHAIWQADAAEAAFEQFLELYQAKYDKACHCLKKYRTILLTFLQLPGRALAAPADHQSHRIELRHHPAPRPEDQGQRQSPRDLDDDVQARPRVRKKLAPTQRP